jgi:hypothetical protein
MHNLLMFHALSMIRNNLKESLQEVDLCSEVVLHTAPIAAPYTASTACKPAKPCSNAQIQFHGHFGLPQRQHKSSEHVAVCKQRLRR